MTWVLLKTVPQFLPECSMRDFSLRPLRPLLLLLVFQKSKTKVSQAQICWLLGLPALWLLFQLRIFLCWNIPILKQKHICPKSELIWKKQKVKQFTLLQTNTHFSYDSLLLFTVLLFFINLHLPHKATVDTVWGAGGKPTPTSNCFQPKHGTAWLKQC